MSTCPTVRVVSPSSPGGYKIINESDLGPEHEVWAGEKAAAEPPEQPRRGRPPGSLNKPPQDGSSL